MMTWLQGLLLALLALALSMICLAEFIRFCIWAAG